MLICSHQSVMFDALSLIDSMQLEGWETSSQRLSLRKPASSEVKTSPEVVVPPASALATPRTALSALGQSKFAFRCGLDALDSLSNSILRGSLDATPRREAAAVTAMSAEGLVGDVTDVAYPCLVPRPIPVPKSTVFLSGILGPDVKVADAVDGANVVVLLPCTSWDDTFFGDAATPARITDAVCVAVQHIPTTDEIIVFGDATTSTPFIVRCRCHKRPCETMLPPDWPCAACDPDAPANATKSMEVKTSLLYSRTFGTDAEAAKRLDFLSTQRTRPPEAGELLREMEPDESVNADLMATEALASTNYGKSTMWSSVERLEMRRTGGALSSLGTTALREHNIPRTWVNESRQALKHRLLIEYHRHRIMSADSMPLEEMQSMFPGQPVAGVLEVYSGSAVVLGVFPSSTNVTATARTLVALADSTHNLPTAEMMHARLSRKPAAAAKREKTSVKILQSSSAKQSSTLRSAGRAMTIHRRNSAVSARSNSSEHSAASGWAAKSGALPTIADLASRTVTTHEVAAPEVLPADLLLHLEAAGCCDLEAGIGWSEYTAHDAKGRVLWKLCAHGRKREPLSRACFPNPEILVPLLRSLDPQEPLGSMCLQLCHAVFPARTDAMWHYLRQLQDWDAVEAHLDNAEEQIRLRITIEPPETGWDITV